MLHMPQLRLHPAHSLETITSGGVPIALSVWRRHPEAVTVLFYPGTMASPFLYPVLLDALWQQGCNVVGVHPLSHGASPRIKKNFVFEDILRNGLDAATWARNTFSGPLVVSGHSQGGILTVAHAARDKDIAAALPICTLLPQHPEAGSVSRFHRHLAHKEKVLKILGALARIFPRLPLPFFAYLELKRITAGARDIVAPRTYTRTSYPACFIHSLFTANLEPACTPGSIKVPVYLFNARDDALFPLCLMQKMLDQIQAPQKVLIPVSGGGHMTAMSALYAPEIAARMAGCMAGCKLPLRRAQ